MKWEDFVLIVTMPLIIVIVALMLLIVQGCSFIELQVNQKVITDVGDGTVDSYHSADEKSDDTNVKLKLIP